MPKIRTKEIDNTGTVSSPEIPNVVYIPGPTGTGSAIAPTLFTSVKKFDDKIADGTYEQGLSVQMAHHLLTLGMHVLYEGVEVSGSSDYKDIDNSVDVDAEGKFTVDGIEFTLAVDKSAVTWLKNTTTKTAAISAVDSVYQATIKDGQNIVIKNLKDNLFKFDFITNKVYYTKRFAVDGNPDSTTWTSIWKTLTDKNLYNVRFLTTGQFFAGSICGVEMIECAAKRCDCVALLDFATTNNLVSEYREFVDAVVAGASALSLDTTKDPASFAAAFAPTWKGNLNTYDGVETIDNLPPSLGYLCAFARSVKENPMWYATAGSFRGAIPELVEVGREYNNADIEMLQARAVDVEVALDESGDNVGIAINPIAYRRPFGHLIWGNRTLRNNSANEVDGTGELKATSFLNCRVLSTEVAKVAYNAANKYTFEQNSEVLWTNFTSYILPTLDRMSTGNGILDYRISRIPTTRKARLCAKISLIPIEAVEDFDITIELTDTISVSE